MENNKDNKNKKNINKKQESRDYESENTEKLIVIRFLQTKKNLAEDIIPVIDSLTIALNSKKDLDIDEKTKAWIDGISASIENLEKVLADMGLKVSGFSYS